jgi:hypothetical protein
MGESTGEYVGGQGGVLSYSGVSETWTQGFWFVGKLGTVSLGFLTFLGQIFLRR